MEMERVVAQLGCDRVTAPARAIEIIHACIHAYIHTYICTYIHTSRAPVGYETHCKGLHAPGGLHSSFCTIQVGQKWLGT